MVSQKMLNQNATMTKLSDRIKAENISYKASEPGFTLVELLVATAIAGLLSALTWTILIENTKDNIRSEFKRRLHEDWNHVYSLHNERSWFQHYTFE